MSPSINWTPVSPQLCSTSPAVASYLIFPHSQSTQKILMAYPDFLTIVDILFCGYSYPHPSSSPSLCPIFSLRYQETHYIWNYSHTGKDLRRVPYQAIPSLSILLMIGLDNRNNKQKKTGTNIQQIKGQISELQRFQTQMLRFHHKNNQ